MSVFSTPAFLRQKGNARQRTIDCPPTHGYKGGEGKRGRRAVTTSPRSRGSPSPVSLAPCHSKQQPKRSAVVGLIVQKRTKRTFQSVQLMTSLTSSAPPLQTEKTHEPITSCSLSLSLAGHKHAQHKKKVKVGRYISMSCYINS